MEKSQPAPRDTSHTLTPLADKSAKNPSGKGPGRVKSLADLAAAPVPRVAVFASPKRRPKIYYAPRRFTLDRKED